MPMLLLPASAWTVAGEPSDQQLERWLKRLPAADANGDGGPTLEEAWACRRKQRESRRKRRPQGPGLPPIDLTEQMPEMIDHWEELAQVQMDAHAGPVREEETE